MKTKIGYLLFFTAMLMAGQSFCQDIRLTSGNLGSLKSESQFNLIYSYENMAVGEFSKEADYKDKKINEYNTKTPGKGDKWGVDWEDNKKNMWEPAFEMMFNKTLKKFKVNATPNNSQSKYTIVVHTVFLEIGFTGWSYANKASEIHLEIAVYSNDNMDTPLATMTIRAQGSASDYSSTSGVRISSAYSLAGKGLGKLFLKYAYK
jgi:hypothetical protein